MNIKYFYIIVFLLGFFIGFIVLAQTDISYDILVNTILKINSLITGNYTTIADILVSTSSNILNIPVSAILYDIVGNYSSVIGIVLSTGSNVFEYNVDEFMNDVSGTISPIGINGYVMVGDVTYTFWSPTTTTTSTAATTSTSTTTSSSSSGGGGGGFYPPPSLTSTVAEPEVIGGGTTVTSVVGGVETVTNVVESLITFVTRQFDVLLLLFALFFAFIVLLAVARR